MIDFQYFSFVALIGFFSIDLEPAFGIWILNLEQYIELPQVAQNILSWLFTTNWEDLIDYGSIYECSLRRMLSSEWIPWLEWNLDLLVVRSAQLSKGYLMRSSNYFIRHNRWTLMSTQLGSLSRELYFHHL